MYLQEILEVAIGLIFVWLAISFTTMSLQEWISNLLNLRAKDLEKTIALMLSSPDLTRRFYEYPLIANLCSQKKRSGRKARPPSYIPANKFSAALFDLVIQAGTENSPIQKMTGEIEKQLVSLKNPDEEEQLRQDWNAIVELAGEMVSSGLGSDALDNLKFKVQLYQEKYPELKPTLAALIPQLDTYFGQFVKESRLSKDSGVYSGLALRQFRLGMLAMQKTNPQLNEAVTAILKQADILALSGAQAITSTRVNLETWFNETMDMLSGAYKRRATLIAFIIGAFLALFLNVDSINVAARLWREPVLRQAILAEARTVTATEPAQGIPETGSPVDIPALETQLQGLNIPLGWTITPYYVEIGLCSLLPAKPGQVWGFIMRDKQGTPVCNGIRNLPDGLSGWLAKILGLLITGLAAAQGAPFWFDILKKFINIRSAGLNPSEAKPVG